MAARRAVNPQSALRSVAEAGAVVLVCGGPGYPDLLAQTASPPAVLFARGNPELLDGPGVAVVGTRRMTPYGRRAARRLAAGLATAGVTVVSGMASGVDTVAHRAALDAGGATAAVLGGGVDVAYPRQNARLLEELAAQGIVVSEYPPGCRPVRGNFPARNRIIAGLSLGTVVVEAGAKSGALITAGAAADEGREVWAVPGPIHAPTHEGALRLLRSGAAVARSAADVLADLGLPEAASSPVVAPEGEAGAGDGADRRLLELLRQAPRHVDEVARALDMPAAEVARRLTALEVRGAVEHVGGMQWWTRD